MIRTRLVDSVKGHEGKRLRAYKDHLGTWTIGYGTNLQALEIDEEQAEKWLLDELEAIWFRLCEVEGFGELSAVRQDVLMEMCYQLGMAGCLRFEKMWAALRRGDFWAAASEMEDSRWAREQTPERAHGLSGRMRHGTWEGIPGGAA